jgi:hypothetical protein
MAPAKQLTVRRDRWVRAERLTISGMLRPAAPGAPFCGGRSAAIANGFGLPALVIRRGRLALLCVDSTKAAIQKLRASSVTNDFETTASAPASPLAQAACVASDVHLQAVFLKSE